MNQDDAQASEIADIFIIGGGVNGCGLARDAAGRGLSVILAEKGDLAQATSSASSKLFHGGLRYLDYLKFRLVRESLQEREVLLVAMPHISWPLRFVLPYTPKMRFATDTPVTRVLSFFMPWLKGRRPAFILRLGLFFYDLMGGRKILPKTRTLDLGRDAAGTVLKPEYRRGFEYSDCWVDDARLVVLNARDAAMRGAKILTRTRVTKIIPKTAIAGNETNAYWEITVEKGHTSLLYRARILVNAAGPWVNEVQNQLVHADSKKSVRLVRGSHIITKKLYDHERCYFFQGQDGRIILVMPYEGDFTLIGTTDIDHHDAPDHVHCTEQERDYLLNFASHYFARPLTAQDVVASYAGVRSLYDDGERSATATSRDYVLSLEQKNGAPYLAVFGGKITTYRRLAEAALLKLSPFLPKAKPAWTARVALPGGNFPYNGVKDLIAKLKRDYAFLSDVHTSRFIRLYGTEAWAMLGQAASYQDLGTDFGASLTQAEVDWLMRNEWAQTAEDVIWRRTKLGLRLKPEQVAALSVYMENYRAQKHSIDSAA